MATEQPVTPQEGPLELPPEAQAWSRARLVAAYACFAAAMLLPFDHPVKSLVIGFSCLAGLIVLDVVAEAIWESLDVPFSWLVLGAAVATALGRFVVPTLHSDSLAVRIGAYVLFLALYVGLFVLFAKATGQSKPLQERPQYNVWRTAALSLAYTGMMISALYLLARFFSATLTLALVAVDLVAAVTTLAARKALRAEATADRRVAWVFTELVAKHPVGPSLAFVGTVAGMFAYPVAVGAIYFAGDVPSNHVTTWVFRLTVTLLFFQALPLAIFMTAGVLASANIDEKTRARQLVTGCASLFTIALFLTLLLWSFDLADASAEVGPASSVLGFSPIVVGVLLGYFLLFVLAPYAVGASRSLRQEHRSTDAQRSILSDVIASLERPYRAGLDDALAKARRDVSDLELRSMCDNAVLALAEKGSRLQRSVRACLPTGIAKRGGLDTNTKTTYRRARDDQRKRLIQEDPRLGYWSQLGLLRNLIDEIAAMLDGRSDAQRKTISREWAEFLRNRRDEMDRRSSLRPRSRIPAWLTIGGLAAPVLSVVLDGFGSWIWTQVTTSFAG
jgi:hypothetical protein